MWACMAHSWVEVRPGYVFGGGFINSTNNIIGEEIIMDKLFVYGIFLSEKARNSWNMTNPEYAVVHGYKTVCKQLDIVEAIPDEEADLTGLLVEITPYGWESLDQMESGYDRIEVETTLGEACYMYVRKEVK